MAELYIGIETGGTKVVAGIARLGAGEPELAAPPVVVPTTADPGRMLDGLVERLSRMPGFPEAVAVGIGSFGPVDLEAGAVLSTPKPGWSGFPLVAEVGRRLDLPIGLDTDVDAAGLAEWRWGAAREATVAVYMTVGTGIGGGLLVGGEPVHGLLHPEMGHIGVTRHPADGFEGACGAHGDCLEGLAAGPAIRARWGEPGESLPDDHPGWEMIAWYLGRGVAQIALTVSPQAVVLGGGVLARDLHGLVEESAAAALGGYVPAPRVAAPRFGARAGLMGTFVLAERAASE